MSSQEMVSTVGVMLSGALAEVSSVGAVANDTEADVVATVAIAVNLSHCRGYVSSPDGSRSFSPFTCPFSSTNS